MTKIIITTEHELRIIIKDCIEEYLKKIAIPKQIQKRYMNLKEFCEYTRIAKPTVYALTSKKIIPFIKKGKRLIFERTKIDEWLDGKT